MSPPLTRLAPIPSHTYRYPLYVVKIRHSGHTDLHCKNFAPFVVKNLVTVGHPSPLTDLLCDRGHAEHGHEELELGGGAVPGREARLHLREQRHLRLLGEDLRARLQLQVEELERALAGHVGAGADLAEQACRERKKTGIRWEKIEAHSAVLKDFGGQFQDQKGIPGGRGVFEVDWSAKYFKGVKSGVSRYIF